MDRHHRGCGSFFDGSHFSSVTGATEGSIFSMLAVKDGKLWLGTEGFGLLHLHHGEATTLANAQGLTDGFVRAILEHQAGHIWVGTDNGLFRIDGGRACQVDTSAFASQLSVHALMQDTSGRIWVGGSKLLVFQPSAEPCRGAPDMVSYTLPGAFSENRIKSILETSDHDLWIGTVGGLDHLMNGRFARVAIVQGTVRTMRQTSDGLLWVGTIGHGLYVHRPHEGFARLTFGGPSGTSINTVLTLFEDDSRQLWVGSQDGLFRLRSTPVRIFALPGDTPPDFATLSLDRDDALWVVSSRVYRLQNGMATPTLFPGLASVRIRNIHRDRSGSLWIGTDGSGVYHQTGSGWVHYLAPDRLVNNFVRAFLEASDGTMWIATDEGVSRINGDHVDKLRMADGLAYFSTRCLLQDRTSDIWIGTERGLSHWSRGHLVHDELTSALAQEKIWSILQERNGTLWFGTRDHGLFHATSHELEHLTTTQGLASDAIYKLLEGAGRRSGSAARTASPPFRSQIVPPEPPPRSRPPSMTFPMAPREPRCMAAVSPPASSMRTATCGSPAPAALSRSSLRLPSINQRRASRLRASPRTISPSRPMRRASFCLRQQRASRSPSLLF